MRQAAVVTRQLFLRRDAAAERINMDNRIAMVSIIVENDESVARLNEVLHEYADHIIGRMGIPYREAGLSLISIAACAPVDRINALTGSLGRLPGVSIIRASCEEAFAKSINSLRSSNMLFAHFASCTHEEVLRLVQIV